TDGTTHDVKVGPDLISTLDLKETKVVCADKGYDSEPLREQIRKTGTKANIPKKTNSQSNNDHMDWCLYKIRHLVENMFCRLKQLSKFCCFSLYIFIANYIWLIMNSKCQQTLIEMTC